MVDAATLAVHVAHVLGDELKPRAQHTSVQFSGYSPNASTPQYSSGGVLRVWWSRSPGVRSSPCLGAALPPYLYSLLSLTGRGRRLSCCVCRIACRNDAIFTFGGWDNAWDYHRDTVVFEIR